MPTSAHPIQRKRAAGFGSVDRVPAFPGRRRTPIICRLRDWAEQITTRDHNRRKQITAVRTSISVSGAKDESGIADAG
jgi:hypothetical protein